MGRSPIEHLIASFPGKSANLPPTVLIFVATPPLAHPSMFTRRLRSSRRNDIISEGYPRWYLSCRRNANRDLTHRRNGRLMAEPKDRGKPMQVDVYKSASNPEKFLSVPTGTDMAKFSLAELDSDYRAVSLSQKGIEVDASIPRAGFRNEAIILDIASHGFSTHTVAISIAASAR
jgi:hypothetical protein